MLEEPSPVAPASQGPGTARLVVITPCRDEADNLPATISTVVKQSLLPTRWVLVDDGSEDDTLAIMEAAAATHEFISVVTRKNRGQRSVGPGVIEAFYSGLDSVDVGDYDYLCKLDGDLELPTDYFQRVVAEMEADACLGNFSGKVYTRLDDGRLMLERMGDENAVGAAKLYRVECFNDIGGFVRQVSWDGIDGHRCRMKGWVASSRDDPELRLIQRRRMGTSGTTLWQGRLRWGRGKYFMGSALYFVIAVSAYRCAERPFLIGGLPILLGYLGAMFSRAERFDDKAFRKHLRAFERSSLFRGKRRTTQRWNDRIRLARKESA